MMNSKERATLKSQANTLPILFQVGKGGVSDALIKQTLEAFNTRELVKLKALLESIPEPPRELAEKIAAGCGAEVVQVIGGSIILYKENPELREENKKKAAAKKAAGTKPRVGIRARQQKAQKQEENGKRTPSRVKSPAHPAGKNGAVKPYRKKSAEPRKKK